MNPPKCRTCGKEEWRHVCGGLKRNGLSPGKGRWPKDKKKQAIRRRDLNAAKEYKAAIKWRDGSSGPASQVRHIDPKDYVPRK